MRMYGWFTGAREPTREELLEERYRLRRLVLDLVPSEYREILTSFYRCSTPEDTSRWRHHMVQQVLDRARPETLDIRWTDQPRVYCPLCGSGTTALYEEGYAYPEGLERHLEGRSNIYTCPVVEVASSAAQHSWHSRFADQVKAEEREESERVAVRRIQELTYVVSLGGMPVLCDEHVYGDGRDTDELLWANERLMQLGFISTEKDRTRQFVWEDERVWAIADPRRRGAISILIYKKPLPKRPRSVRAGQHLPIRFELPDRWKNDLPAKFKQAVELAAVRSRKRTGR